MLRYPLIAAAALLASCQTAPSPAQSRQTPNSQSAIQASLAKKSPHRHAAHPAPPSTRRDSPGAFDFYVAALSWSPGFCATPAGRNDDLQCGTQRNFAFVLHGLWPQYEKGGWPETCSNERLDRRLIDPMLDIMPSPGLIRHEWDKHGTCSGLSSKEYLEDAADAFRSIKIPALYAGPKKQITVNPDDVQREFARANPEIGEEGFVVTCTGNGRFLQEVRACFTRDLAGRACNREVQRQACRSDEVIMRPVR